jgi:4-hydroxybenzoate polyprenyltransferase
MTLTTYYKMLRLDQQATILVCFLFGVIDAKFFHLPTIFWLSVGLLFHSISIFFLNDYIDAMDTDKHSLEDRPATKTKISLNPTIVIWFALILIGSLPLLYYGLFWQLAILIVLGFLYNFPPFRLKAKFPHDSFCVYTHFVLIPYSIPFAMNNLPFTEVFSIPFISLTLFIAVAQGIHYLADLKADKEAGLANTPVVLGYSNLLKVVIYASFGSFLGFIYLVHHHSHWWYYPLIPFNILAVLALGYARGNIYNQEKLTARFTWSKKTAINFSTYLLIYEIIVIYLLANHVVTG